MREQKNETRSKILSFHQLIYYCITVSEFVIVYYFGDALFPEAMYELYLYFLTCIYESSKIMSAHTHVY